MPNSWKIVISCMEIRMVVTDGDIIRLDEFIHLYRLKKSKLADLHPLLHDP